MDWTTHPAVQAALAVPRCKWALSCWRPQCRFSHGCAATEAARARSLAKAWRFEADAREAQATGPAPGQATAPAAAAQGGWSAGPDAVGAVGPSDAGLADPDALDATGPLITGPAGFEIDSADAADAADAAHVSEGQAPTISSDVVGFGWASKSLCGVSQDVIWATMLHTLRNPAEYGQTRA
eukprot:CAMPEP_0204607038 /NCGR_PEP_ID=MMETSP0661-20131031/59455_1 /ASSEMBLY_ACC=CAM_ASM_000606 /TAXON_ID=109239 /ORGANISM="Alexandrium margalefi, Strain AMGDE01CS-322" /LENGTH=181 /DNA_ID=CAMNT_0051618411 /DNA_START=176 /DNA_END=721 /DNA_ORIENTATION=-